MTIRTGKDIVHSSTYGGSQRWLDLLSAAKEGPSDQAAIVEPRWMIQIIDKNTKNARDLGIQAAIDVLRERLKYYEQERAIDPDDRYWVGSVSTTNYLIRRLGELKGEPWEPGDVESAPDAESAPVRKQADDQHILTVKVPV